MPKAQLFKHKEDQIKLKCRKFNSSSHASKIIKIIVKHVAKIDYRYVNESCYK